MFKDRIFNFSILFSTAWHLFWIFAITIVVTPRVETSNVYQEVVFLGPILEKTAFDIMVEEVKPQAETVYTRSMLSQEFVYLKPEGPRRKILKEFEPDTIRDKFSFSLKDYFKEEKDIPLYFSEDIKPPSYRFAEKEEPCAIDGPAKERGIIFKPSPPTVQRILYKDTVEYIVKLKFFISSDGMVYDAKPLVSSGHPEIDLAAMRFLECWRFAPLPAGEETISTWGVTTVKIDAK